MAEKKYIEVNALFKTVEDYASTHPVMHDNELFALFCSVPAADVWEVKRGKWVNYGDEYRPDIKCCVCGQRKPILLGNFNFNFCPNCGADMKEK